jgi:hypothetical protein
VIFRLDPVLASRLDFASPTLLKLLPISFPAFSPSKISLYFVLVQFWALTFASFCVSQATKVKGYVPLSDYTTVEIWPERKHAFKVYHKDREDARKFFIQAKDDDEMHDWMRLLTSGIEVRFHSESSSNFSNYVIQS